METRNSDTAIGWSAFWRRVIEPVIFGTMTPEEALRYLRDLSTFHLRFPDGTVRSPSLRSLRHALRVYHRHGFGEWDDETPDGSPPRKSS